MTEAEKIEYLAGGVRLISRRQFLQYTTSGVLVFLCSDEVWAARRELPADFNAFLRIGEDGRVTCYTGKIEMGQGVITSLPQMLADELDVALESVDIVMGDTSLCPWDAGTFGSLTTRVFGPALRKAAAEARTVLIELAAEKLKVKPDKLAAENGAVFDPSNPDKKVTYAQLAEGRRIERHVKGEVPVKDPAELEVMGKPFKRRDAAAKVTGKAQYTADIRLPGMLYAAILRPPAHGATLGGVDTSAAEKLPGVQVVRDGDLLAVLHEKPDVAEKALKEVKAEFTLAEPFADDKTIFSHLLDCASPEGREVQKAGEPDGTGPARTVLEETYYNSYVAHAALETHSALAQMDGDAITVWASTQTPFRLQEEVAAALDFPLEKVRVIVPFVGGGFGGKSRNTQAVDAARLAKRTGKPVQVVYTRKEEFFFDTFRPAAVVRIKAGVDASGKLALWDYGVYFAGERGSALFYDAPNLRTVSYGRAKEGMEAHPFATGPWRAPANNTNTFARESHIDMLAAKIGMDPVEFRLKNLSDPRMIATLGAAAGAFGWTPGKGPSGRGFGVACGIDSGTCVATMAAVEVDKASGAIRVNRVVAAQDMGFVVNPAGAKLQMEGCVTMGLGYALTEEVHFKGGDVLDTSFATYKLPRFSWLPKIETILVENNELAPQGGGEPAIITMGGALANAVFDACGARLFQLPMTSDRVKEALASRA